MKAFLEFYEKLYFFKASVSELRECVQAQFFERMVIAKPVGEDEILHIEGFSFPLCDFISQNKAFSYRTRMPEFVSLESEVFFPVGAESENQVKLVVMTPCYSFDTGDEPEYRYSYFEAKSQAHFEEKFKEKAKLAFDKHNSGIDFGKIGFCTDDFVHKTKKEMYFTVPESFVVA